MNEAVPDRLIGMKDICNFLKISESTALKWSREYGLPIKKTGDGGYWVGSRTKLDAWFKEFVTQ